MPRDRVGGVRFVMSVRAGHPPDALVEGFTVMVMIRQCSRCGCAEAASATLTFQYARALVWIDDLSAERDPHGYDLCVRHTRRLSAPNGWRVEDRRTAQVLAMSGFTRLAG